MIVLRPRVLNFTKMSTLGKRKLEHGNFTMLESTKVTPTLASIFNPNRTRLIWKASPHEGLKFGTYGEPDLTRKKVAAFDLDGTLIRDAKGIESSWVPRDTTTFAKVRKIHEEGYTVVIISNQGLNDARLKKLDEAKFFPVARKLDLPAIYMAATAYNWYRKPMPGMWEALASCYGTEIDLSQSFYVGDAAGRPQDHSDSDRKFALNAGLKFYTPEEYFDGKPLQPFRLSGINVNETVLSNVEKPLFTPTNTPLVPPLLVGQTRNSAEIVLFVGFPGVGKTSFYRKYFQPRGYQHINLDTLKSRNKSFEIARECLAQNVPLVIDNTSPAAETRQDWIHLAKEFKVPIRCIQFTGSGQLGWHNNLFRALVPRPDGTAFDRTLLPVEAYTTFSSRFEPPKLTEGFQEGTPEERRLYSLWLELGARYKRLEQPENNFKRG